MKKSQATNTFNKGMIMDLDPLVTPNDVVTNCLNGTLVTFNGNENVLQNDMGNGKVETAYLPEGYVPLGTAELGGIIYVVSYNPLKNKCQVGSFPSPERNISSDETSNIIQTLDNKDFIWDETNGAKVYYLKKDLDSELTFNPGDKFIVYGHDIIGNMGNFYDSTEYTSNDFNKAKEQTIRLDIGTITDTGKLVKFSDLKQYSIKDTDKKYHIYEYEGDSEGTKKPDIDDYKSITSQPYNVFSSKVSGKLVLIAELVQCNTFDIEISHKFQINKETLKKEYIPNVTFNFGGEYPFVPIQVKCSLSIPKKDIAEDFYIDITEQVEKTIDSDNQNYSILIENILSQDTVIKNIVDSIDFNEKDRNSGCILNYTFIPCMNWGPVSYLAVSGSIDLDKLGTGYIGLTTWRYYKQNSMSLTWGLEVYEEEGYGVTNVSMEFIRLLSENVAEASIYSVSKKASYHGIFYDTLPLDQKYFKLTKPLVSNTLYLVKIIVTYAKTREESSTKTTSENKVFYRWMYTNEVFNSYYASTTDFIGLSLSLDPNFSINYTSKTTDKDQSKIYGVINPSTEEKTEEEKTALKNSKTSLSCIQTLRNSNIDCKLSVGLKKAYNTFYLEYQNDTLSLNIDKDNIQATESATITYTDREDSNQDSYLFSTASVVDSLDTYKLDSSSGTDKSDEILGTNTNPFPTNALHLITSDINSNFKDNVYSFQIQYEALQMVKAYCTKVESSLIYSGRLLPLAYDNNSFELYNLRCVNGNMQPVKLGTYGFHESGGTKGYAYIGHADSEVPDSDEKEVDSGDNVNLNWTTNELISSAEQLHGWTNTAIFAVHWSGGNGSCQVMNTKPYKGNDSIYSQALEEFRGKYGRTRVQLMLKSNSSSYFYPIDFSMASKANDYSTVLSLQKDLYNAFAQILGNLYRYDSEGMSTACLIPKSIYYMNNCIYGLTLPISISSTDGLQQCKVQIQLDSGKVSLNDIIDILKRIKIEGEKETIIPKDYQEEKFENNLKYELSKINSTYKLNITNTDKTSGISLRNYMLDLQTTTQGICIMDYNGKDIIGNSAGNYSSNKLYYIIKGDTVIVKSATKVPFKQIKYSTDSSGNLVVNMTNTSLETSVENLNDRFQLNDGGLLILKDPPSSEYEMVRQGYDDDGVVRGFQKARLLNTYRYYS